MNEEKIMHYDEAIRHSIEKENEVRNQRTNWFLVFQGLLINAIVAISIKGSMDYLIVFLAIIGLILSLCFMHAAWRSEMAIKMLLACWDEFRNELNLPIKDFYPVTTLTEGLIKVYFKGEKNHKDKDEDNDWEKNIAERMSLGKWDKRRNKYDCLMPYKAFPMTFAIIWSILCLYELYKIIQLCL